MKTPPTSTVHWLNLRYTEQQCPGMNDILTAVPGQQSALVRGILYQWCLEHQEAGTLVQATLAALNGPGVKGKRGLRRSAAKKESATESPVAAIPQAKRDLERMDHAVPPAATETERQEPHPVRAPAVQFAVASPAPQHADVAHEQVPPDSAPSSGTAADALFNMFDD